MNFKQPCRRNVIPWVVSLILMIAGVLLFTSWFCIYELITKSLIVLTPTSMAFQVWKKNPLPMPLDFYFYNWTNPEDIHNSTIKPSIKEVGPYRFQETREKSQVVWNTNHTVSYKMYHTFKFVPEMSVGPLTDQITTVNPVSVSAVHAARNWNYIVKKGLSIAMKTMAPNIHITKSVGQMLFEGYDDPLMNAAKKMPFLAKSEVPAMEKFGWFFGRNNTDDFDGNFNMDTGVHGILGRLYRWNFQSRSNYFQKHCNDIQGSAGDFFPPNLSRENTIKFFSPEICRPVELDYEADNEIHGVLGFKYTAGDKFLDNGTKVPENKCFYLGDNLPSGLVNVSSCRYGTPSFVSLPHFYKADPYYRDKLEGVAPDPVKHEFYMIFEPKTAIPLEVVVRLQLNLMLQSDDDITLYNDVPKVYFPVMWFEQSAKLPAEKATLLKILINFQIICYIIGSILIFTALLIHFCMYYKKKRYGKYERTTYEKSPVKNKENIPLNYKIHS